MNAALLALAVLTGTPLEAAREAATLEPTRPRVLLALAHQQAVGGALDEVPATLERLAAMGLAFSVEDEPEFAKLKGTPAFTAVVKHFAQNQAAVQGSASTVFSLKNPELVEGVAYDAARHRYLVGSVRERKIFAVDAAGVATDFTREGLDVGGVFGLVVDAKRGVLWATTAWLPQVKGYVAEKTGLLKLDLKSGALLGSWWLGAGHVLGDLVVSPSGDVYASDSRSKEPAIYKLEKNGLTEWVKGSFRSLQGMAWGAGDRLYVADYALGLFVVDVKTRKVSPLKTPLDVASVGIDGLYLVNGALVATQNGISPQRVIQFSLDAKGLSVTGQKVLLVGDPRADDLSLGVVVGKTLVVNGHSGWSAFEDDGKVTGAFKPSPFLSISLPASVP